MYVWPCKEEKAALEKAYLKHQLQLQMSLAPVDAAPAAAAPAVAPKSKPVVAAAAPPPEPSEGRGLQVTKSRLSGFFFLQLSCAPREK